MRWQENIYVPGCQKICTSCYLEFIQIYKCVTKSDFCSEGLCIPCIVTLLHRTFLCGFRSWWKTVRLLCLRGPFMDLFFTLAQCLASVSKTAYIESALNVQLLPIEQQIYYIYQKYSIYRVWFIGLECNPSSLNTTSLINKYNSTS